MVPGRVAKPLAGTRRTAPPDRLATATVTARTTGPAGRDRDGSLARGDRAAHRHGAARPWGLQLGYGTSDAAGRVLVGVRGRGIRRRGHRRNPDVDATSIGSFPFVDDQMRDTLERPVVLDGRLPDTTRADEVAVTQKFVDSFHEQRRRHRDVAPVQRRTARRLRRGRAEGGDRRRNDRRRRPIAMVQRSPDAPTGAVFSSPGLATQYPDDIAGTASAVNVDALVRLKQGEAGIDEFEREFTQVTGIDNAEFRGSYDEVRHARAVTAFEARVLLWCRWWPWSLPWCSSELRSRDPAPRRFANLEVLRAFGLAPTQTLFAVAIGPVSVCRGRRSDRRCSRRGGHRAGSRSAAQHSSNRRPACRSIRSCCSSQFVIVPLLVFTTPVFFHSVLRASPTCSATRVSVVDAATASWPVTVGIGTRSALSGRSARNSSSGIPALVAAVIGIAGVVAALTLCERHRRRHERVRTIRTDLRTRRLLR